MFLPALVLASLQAPQVSTVSVFVDTHTGLAVAASPGQTAMPVGAELCFQRGPVLDLPTVSVSSSESLLACIEKDCGGTNLVDRLTLTYETTALDPFVGGPGASFHLALLEGSACEGEDQGVEVFSALIDGLAGTFAPAAPAERYEAHIVLEPAIALPDGPVGIAIFMVDAETSFPQADAEFSGVEVIDGPLDNGMVAETYDHDYASIANHPDAIALDISDEDDDVESNVLLGFEFDYFGVPISSVEVQTNGSLHATHDGYDEYEYEDCLPVGSDPLDSD